MFRRIIVVVVAALAGPIASAQDPAASEIAKKVEGVLKARCFHCHGLNGQAEANVFVLDRERLVKDKMVVPGNLTSKLLRVVEAGSMPADLFEKNEKLPEAEVVIIRNWISGGAPPFDEKKAAPRTFLSDATLLREVEADLRSADSRSRTFLRYFSIAHLYNSLVAEDELEGYRIGLSKLLNSLSWQKEIAVPRPVNESKTLLRIDLRDYKWEAATWRRILADYPYGYLAHGSRAIHDLSGAELPFVRADWIVATASAPPLYHDLLDLPTTLAPLEARLDVNVKRNLHDEHGVVRAGIRDSGVSKNNRVVERHNSSFGAYWKSYDFSSSVGEQNMFRNPLDLKAAGGEMVFNLPNGMQGYLIVDAEDKRIDEAPVAIVSDRTQPEEPVVRNGISCMGCHYAGMKRFKDDVRAAVKQSPGGFDHEKVLALYPEQERVEQLLDQDTQRFTRAIEESGGKVSVDHRTEPINRLARKYKAPLNAELAAAEAGHEVTRFKEKLAQSRILTALGITGQLTGPNPGIKRDTWEENFGLVVAELALGDYQTPAGRYPGSPTASGSVAGFQVSLHEVTKYAEAVRDLVRIGSAADPQLEAEGSAEGDATVLLLLSRIREALKNTTGPTTTTGAKQVAAQAAIHAARDLVALKDKPLAALAAAIHDRGQAEIRPFLEIAENTIYESLCTGAIAIYIVEGSFQGTFDGMFAVLDKYDRSKVGDGFLAVFRNASHENAVRQLAGEGLAQMGSARHLPALREIHAQASKDEVIRLRALQTLARLGDRGPVDKELAAIEGRMARTFSVNMSPQQTSEWALGHSDKAYLTQTIRDNAAAIRHFKDYLDAVEPIQSKLAARLDLSGIHYNIACLHSLAGDVNAGIAAIQRAFDAGYLNYDWANTDGDLANIRKDPRFNPIVERARARNPAAPGAPALKGPLQPEHGALKNLVGSWNGSQVFRFPNGTQSTRNFSEVDFVFFDDLFLYRIWEAETEIRSILGFDRHKKKFVQVDFFAKLFRPTFTESDWDERSHTLTTNRPSVRFDDGTIGSQSWSSTFKDAAGFTTKGLNLASDGRRLYEWNTDVRRAPTALKLPTGNVKENVTLADQHHLFEDYVGNWEGTATVNANGTSQTGKATESNALLFGGTWLQSVLTIELNGKKLFVLQLVGFDTSASRFRSIWVDSKGRLEIGEASAFDDRSATFHGETYDDFGARVPWSESVSWSGEERRLVTWRLLDASAKVRESIDLNLLLKR